MNDPIDEEELVMLREENRKLIGKLIHNLIYGRFH